MPLTRREVRAIEAAAEAKLAYDDAQTNGGQPPPQTGEHIIDTVLGGMSANKQFHAMRQKRVKRIIEHPDFDAQILQRFRDNYPQWQSSHRPRVRCQHCSKMVHPDHVAYFDAKHGAEYRVEQEVTAALRREFPTLAEVMSAEQRAWAHLAGRALQRAAEIRRDRKKLESLRTTPST